MQKLCCVRTRQQFSASLDYFVTSSPPYLHQFSTISGGNCIKGETVLDMSWIQFPLRRETKDTHKRCVRIPSPAAGEIEKPSTSSISLHLKWKISIIEERSRSNIYQRFYMRKEALLCRFQHIWSIGGWR